MTRVNALIPTREELDSLAGHIIQVAKSKLKTKGRVYPIAVVMLPNKGYSVIDMDFADERRKHREMDKLISKLHRLKATGAMVVSEVWVSMLKPGETEESLGGRPVRERDNKTEAISVAVKTWNESFVTVAPFHKDDKGNFVFEEEYSIRRLL